MIRRARAEDKATVMSMWDRVFGESPQYMELYFGRKYRDRLCYVAEEPEGLASSLQVLPYGFGLWGKPVEMGYISGVATLPELRGRGHMSRLLEGTFRGMAEDGFALATLIPAEPSLFGLYERFGFACCFDMKNTMVHLDAGSGEMLHPYKGELEEVYACYDRWQIRFPCGVRKSMEDLSVVIDEHQAGQGTLWLAREQEGVEAMAFAILWKGELMVKELLCREEQRETMLRSLMRHYGTEHAILLEGGAGKRPFGMARCIDLPAMLERFAAGNPQLKREFQVEDPLLPANSGGYQLWAGRMRRVPPHGPLMKMEELVQWMLRGGDGAHPVHAYMNMMLN